MPYDDDPKIAPRIKQRLADHLNPPEIVAAKLAVHIYCPGCFTVCELVVDPDGKPDHLRCVMPQCRYINKRFAIPTVDLRVMAMTDAKVIALPPK